MSSPGGQIGNLSYSLSRGFDRLSHPDLVLLTDGVSNAGELDPQKAIEGIILPMAEHKGYAIAAMVDMLSGVLTGSGFLSSRLLKTSPSEPASMRPTG